MKKLFLISVVSTMTVLSANAAINWWEQPTVCKINPTNCYSNMTAGYYVDIGNPETWDASGNCWGLKIICANALTNGATENTTMSSADISQQKNISRDFDTNVLSTYNECFGVRKSNSDGSRASVNGEYVNVWCENTLSGTNSTIEETKNGYVITSGDQPTCKSLARDEYVAVLDNQNGCYGKHFNSAEYYIDCGTNQIPDRLIVLNGADYSESGNAPTLTPKSASKLFEEMFSVSEQQRNKYSK